MDPIIGIDFGKARIGVAISDSLGMLAHPRFTVPASPEAVAIEKIIKLAREERASLIVVGLPYNIDGTLGPSAAAAQVFGTKLAKASVLPVKYWDERLSTVAAQEMLHAAGRNAKQSKSVIDQVAARVILQSYMDANITPPEL